MTGISEISNGFDSGIFTTDTSGEFNIPTGSEFDDLMKGELTEISSSAIESEPYEQPPLEYDNSSELNNNATLMKALLGKES